MEPRRRSIATDADFDVLLPVTERAASARYWTPVAVARRVANILDELGVRRVLDVGAGPGKFCVVGAARLPDVEFVGVEQRPHLVAIADRLAGEVGAHNAKFHVGDVTRAPWSNFDALYVFNSFAENLYSGFERFDSTVELSRVRYVADLEIVARRLAELPQGTILATYHGLGGPIPCAYEHLAVEPAGTGWIHFWRHQGAPTNEVFWIEDEADVYAVPPGGMSTLLRSVDHAG